MVEVLRVLLGVLVVASFGTMAVYVLVSVAVAASTLLGTVRRDRSADELRPIPRRDPRAADARRGSRAWQVAGGAAPLSTPRRSAAASVRGSLLTDDRVLEGRQPGPRQLDRRGPQARPAHRHLLEGRGRPGGGTSAPWHRRRG